MFLLFSPMNQLSSVARSHGISWKYHLRVSYYERLTFCSRTLWEVLLFTWLSDFYDLFDIGLRIFNSNIVTPFQTLTLSRLDFSKVIENRVALKSSTETDRKSLVTEFKISGNFMAGRDVLEEFYARIWNQRKISRLLITKIACH